MISLRRWTFAFLGGVVLLAHNGLSEGFSFSHKDWELVCDNTRTCRAAGYQADGDGTAPTKVSLQIGKLDIANIAIDKELSQETAAKLLAVMPDEKKNDFYNHSDIK